MEKFIYHILSLLSVKLQIISQNIFREFADFNSQQVCCDRQQSDSKETLKCINFLTFSEYYLKHYGFVIFGFHYMLVCLFL
jgi:hypothetical protein